MGGSLLFATALNATMAIATMPIKSQISLGILDRRTNPTTIPTSNNDPAEELRLPLAKVTPLNDEFGAL
jgi:hypothetical protein